MCRPTYVRIHLTHCIRGTLARIAVLSVLSAISCMSYMALSTPIGVSPVPAVVANLVRHQLSLLMVIISRCSCV
jgi:hypothetical protein